MESAQPIEILAWYVLWHLIIEKIDVAEGQRADTRVLGWVKLAGM